MMPSEFNILKMEAGRFTIWLWFFVLISRSELVWDGKGGLSPTSSLDLLEPSCPHPLGWVQTHLSGGPSHWSVFDFGPENWCWNFKILVFFQYDFSVFLPHPHLLCSLFASFFFFKRPFEYCLRKEFSLCKRAAFLESGVNKLDLPVQVSSCGAKSLGSSPAPSPSAPLASHGTISWASEVVVSSLGLRWVPPPSGVRVREALQVSWLLINAVY